MQGVWRTTWTQNNRKTHYLPKMDRSFLEDRDQAWERCAKEAKKWRPQATEEEQLAYASLRNPKALVATLRDKGYALRK